MGGGVASGARRAARRRRLPAGVLMAAVLMVNAADTLALGRFEYPSTEEIVTHVRGILAFEWPVVANGRSVTAGKRRVRCSAELSEQRLYGISGLRMPGIRVGIRRETVSVFAEASQLSSPVGRETRLAFTPAYYRGGRWGASVGVVHECAAVDGFLSASMVTLTARSVVHLSERVVVGGEADGYRLSGEPNDGVDVSVACAARVVPAIVVRLVMDVGRWTGAQPAVSATFLGLRAVRLSLGYEGKTGVLGAALTVAFRGVACTVGECHHPVLGLRRGITLAWGVGRWRQDG